MCALILLLLILSFAAFGWPGLVICVVLLILGSLEK